MDHSARKCRLHEDDKAKLDDWPTKIAPIYRSKDDYKAILDDHVGRLAKLQDLLYASATTPC